jgi:DNA-binding transcriptional LysR family regulator
VTFRIGFVTGAMPDRWADTWRKRRREPIELVPVTEADQERVLRDGSVDMAIVRLPVDREGLHLVPLYHEKPVAVMGTEHLLTLADELTTADLADEQVVIPERSGWRPEAQQLAWPPMSEKDAVETVAAGTGVALMPMSVARLYHRRDATYRVVTDLPTSGVGLAWLVENDGALPQAFVGIVRGRREGSSRG